MTAPKGMLTSAQEKAISLAYTHKCVVVGNVFGGGKRAPNTIAAKTWVRLVVDGYLTPFEDGLPFKGKVVTPERGRPAYLTEKGTETERARRSR
jgi:hypothetical protein